MKSILKFLSSVDVYGRLTPLVSIKPIVFLLMTQSLISEKNMFRLLAAKIGSVLVHVSVITSKTLSLIFSLSMASFHWIIPFEQIFK